MIATTQAVPTSPGIYPGVPSRDYHQKIDAYNPSLIKELIQVSAKSMQHMKQHPRERTQAMLIGAATHKLVLPGERGDFNAAYAIWEGDRRGNKYKEFKAEAIEAGREILKGEDYDAIRQINKAVKAHGASMELLNQNGQAELTIIWIDKQTGLTCKGRIDWWHGSVTDLKTSRDVRPYYFCNDMARRLHHVSVGAYITGLRTLGEEVDGAHLIAAKNCGDHDVVRYDLSDSFIRRGITEWHKALQRVKWCEKNNQWPGIAEEPYPLELPNWAMPDDEVESITIEGKAAFERID